ncbi:MAG: hypothetical protein Q9222_003250 [Ikaeria aurantiellina]
MASITDVRLDEAFSMDPSKTQMESHIWLKIDFWASTLRQNLNRMLVDSPVALCCFSAPRRKARNPDEAKLAEDVAQLLYPTTSESPLPALIKYEKDVARLRRQALSQATVIQRKEPKPKYGPTLKERVRKQGEWDPHYDFYRPYGLTGAPALPMPVKVSSEETLLPFLRHLSQGGGHQVEETGGRTEEPHYGVDMGKWEKGMLYEDGRMDLCKITFVRHFLLGNNIIGSTGANHIASYLSQYPDQMETWYLAGNCIGPADLEKLAEGWIKSSKVTNIWLKRNPLGPSSAQTIFRIITSMPRLRTLDLDQIELGDKGVIALFDLLARAPHSKLPLRHIYLNANGVGYEASWALGDYLGSKHCLLESLYISNNPIGHHGAVKIANGLYKNKSLMRLSMRSCGINTEGGEKILFALLRHPSIMTLDLGQSYATKDLGSRYNFFTSDGVTCLEHYIVELIKYSSTLRFIDLGVTSFSLRRIEGIVDAVCNSENLLAFKLDTVYQYKKEEHLKRRVRAQLTESVKRLYGNEMTYQMLEEGDMRWLRSPKDVRFIDSGYRNQDTRMARRGLMVLDKWWKDLDELTNILGGDSKRTEPDDEEQGSLEDITCM